jgi:hypothetical protein
MPLAESSAIGHIACIATNWEPAALCEQMPQRPLHPKLDVIASGPRGDTVPAQPQARGCSASQALSDTSLPSNVPTPLPMSASVNTRHVPPAKTSAGRKRDLYAILRLSFTQ